MTDLFHAADRADHHAARLLLPHLAADSVISRRLINDIMVTAFGGSDADGRWTQRTSFEVLEHALAVHLRSSGQGLNSFAEVSGLVALSERLPTQTVRSEEQLDWQQFSTPVDIAAVAVLLADVQPDDVILEPSAGNGLLVAQIGQHKALHLNELDPLRRGRLHHVFPEATISGEDGATINSTLAAAERPSLILMNPPFSRSLGRGADDYAAVRHLQAALRRLQSGGRLVAIMPDWFGPSARMRDQYETVLRNVTVQTSVRLEKCYLKHGTSIAVRLFVIDKVPGKAPPSVIQRSSVAELLDALRVPERSRARRDECVPAPKRSGGISLFRAVKSSRPEPRTFHAPVRNDVLPVEYEKLATPAPLLQQTGVYLPYRPSRISFATAGEHPTALVESVAMGSIPAPVPDYVPSLPERTVAERLLSASQLETVVYAGHAWAQTIPGRFKPNKEGVGLTLAEDGEAYRKGFFLGDGTGAGKGRQIAACILDNWLQGRRRNIWVTKNAPLLLSRLCESVLARAPPVQWGGYSRRMDITRPITMLTRLKPGQHCDLPFPEAHAATVLHGSRRPENARRCRWRCRSTYHGRDSGDGKLRPCRGHALHPRRGWQLRPRPQQVLSCRSDHGRSIAEQPARLCARYRRVAALPRGAARWKIFMGGGSRGHRSLP
ncbi:MAG: strawberry notch family protein [Sphingomonas sanguinis]|nr:strawberry notch family protein [Sphingomonas sanguinis]